MIQEFDSFCGLSGLRYFLDGGTLLGAIREGGFIPWDDDVDIVMPRSDYERFIKEWNGKMCLFCHEKDKNFFFPYIKLFHPEMPIVEIEDNSKGFKGKVFLKIDIYPMDGISSEPRSAARHLSFIQRWKQLLFLSCEKSLPRSFIKRIGYKLLRLIPVDFFYNRLERAMRRYDYETSLFVTRWRICSGSISVFEKSIIEPFRRILFEHLYLSCPADSDYYLRRTYGNYMQPVSQNEGLRHSTMSSNIASDFENYIKKR